MEIKIEDLCRHLEAVASFSKKVKVEYFNGIKPASYFVPQIVTTKMALSGDADKIMMAWFAEIFVDGVCIYRECWSPGNEEEQDWKYCEERANQKLIESVFCYGVMSSRNDLFNMRMNKNSA